MSGERLTDAMSLWVSLAAAGVLFAVTWGDGEPSPVSSTAAPNDAGGRMDQGKVEKVPTVSVEPLALQAVRLPPPPAGPNDREGGEMGASSPPSRGASEGRERRERKSQVVPALHEPLASPDRLPVMKEKPPSHVRLVEPIRLRQTQHGRGGGEIRADGNERGGGNAESVPHGGMEAVSGEGEGGVLLRLLEHGEGPYIEVAWPTELGGRVRLFRLLKRCYGMSNALMDETGRLYRLEEPPGRAWVPDRDRFSGFVRQPDGYMAPEEKGLAVAIKEHHRLTRKLPLVRLFPRGVDASLLSGLRQRIGRRYAEIGRVSGRYRMTSDGVVVEGIEAAGRPVQGAVALGTCP